jgi:hypothetical protein
VQIYGILRKFWLHDIFIFRVYSQYDTKVLNLEIQNPYK